MYVCWGGGVVRLNNKSFKVTHVTHHVFLHLQVHANPPNWDGYPDPSPPPAQPANEEGAVTGHWDRRVTSFHKLIMIKEEKVD